jgi:hypothetical protein
MINLPAKFTIDYLDHLGILVFPFCREYITGQARPGRILRFSPTVISKM